MLPKLPKRSPDDLVSFMLEKEARYGARIGLECGTCSSMTISLVGNEMWATFGGFKLASYTCLFSFLLLACTLHFFIPGATIINWNSLKVELF